MSLPEIKVTGRVLTLSASTMARNQNLGASESSGRGVVDRRTAPESDSYGLASEATKQQGQRVQTPQTRPSLRIRQAKEPKLNKLEREALEWLKRVYTVYQLEPHAIRLQLANGCNYTPDIIGRPVGLPDEKLRAWEVKGKHAWDDSIVKLKVAASTWPQIQFTLIWKDGEGTWQQQEVLP